MDNMVKCSGPGCTREFENRAGKKYCSGSCRAKASLASQLKLSGLTPEAKTQNVGLAPIAKQQDPSSLYIINHLTEEKKRWETLYNTERESRKKLKEKNEELEKKILQMENEQRISAIENAKPSGLNGILQTEAGTKLIELCAPLIQKILEPGAAAAPQIAGTPGQQTPAALFEQWFNKLTLPTQQTVWRMLQQFSIMPDAEMNQYAASVIDQLKYAYPNQAVNQ